MSKPQRTNRHGSCILLLCKPHSRIASLKDRKFVLESLSFANKSVPTVRFVGAEAGAGLGDGVRRLRWCIHSHHSHQHQEQAELAGHYPQLFDSQDDPCGFYLFRLRVKVPTVVSIQEYIERRSSLAGA